MPGAAEVARRQARELVKSALSRLESGDDADGATLLIYHRVGGAGTDELDIARERFAGQMETLASHEVLSLDAAVDRIESGDHTPAVVLTFDDGFADVYHHAWPTLRDRQLPFTVYVASAFVGAPMQWAGSSSRDRSGVGLSWAQLDELIESGLCTLGNHTHRHAHPGEVRVEDVEQCDDVVRHHLGVTMRHFAYPWGAWVPGLDAHLRARFRTASTGELGRNRPGDDLHRLRRVPVRGTDPDRFFEAKLSGQLRAEHAYQRIVAAAKRLGVRA